MSNQINSLAKIKIAIGLFLAMGVVGAALAFSWYAYNHYYQGYQPVQPIPFSHRLHAGVNKIPCLYCHSSVDKSKTAGVPGLGVCMNCHTQVKAQSPLIRRIKKQYEQNLPIAWVKVHVMPDFVHFNHKRHVNFGVQCTQCHGDVASMHRVRQVEPLSMGWCVNCHRKPEHKAPIDCVTCHH